MYVENVLLRQQFNHWRFYELNRMNDAFTRLEEEAQERQAAENAAKAAADTDADATNDAR